MLGGVILDRILLQQLQNEPCSYDRLMSKRIVLRLPPFKISSGEMKMICSPLRSAAGLVVAPDGSRTMTDTDRIGANPGVRNGPKRGDSAVFRENGGRHRMSAWQPGVRILPL
jgi:hypothetical protein